MSRLRVNAFGISIDGHGAGPDQDLANPMGASGMALHQWVLGTKTFQKMAADFAGSLTAYGRAFFSAASIAASTDFGSCSS